MKISNRNKLSSLALLVAMPLLLTACGDEPDESEVKKSDVVVVESAGKEKIATVINRDDTPSEPEKPVAEVGGGKAVHKPSITMGPLELCKVYEHEPEMYDECILNTDSKSVAVDEGEARNLMLVEYIQESIERYGKDALSSGLTASIRQEAKKVSPMMVATDVHEFGHDIVEETVYELLNSEDTEEDIYGDKEKEKPQEEIKRYYYVDGDLFAIDSVLPGGMTVIIEQRSDEVLLQAQLMTLDQHNFLRDVCLRAKNGHDNVCTGRVYFTIEENENKEAALEMVGADLKDLDKRIQSISKVDLSFVPDMAIHNGNDTAVLSTDKYAKYFTQDEYLTIEYESEAKPEPEAGTPWGELGMEKDEYFHMVEAGIIRANYTQDEIDAVLRPEMAMQDDEPDNPEQ